MIRGKRILLRAVEKEDAGFVFSLENDSALWLVSNTLVPYSRYTIEQFVSTASRDIYATKQLRLIIDILADEGDQKSIGAADLFEFDPRHMRAGIGIAIIPEERNQGYAGEAIGLLLNYCFDILNLHQVWCSIPKENNFSIKLFTTAGFEITGTKKQWLTDKGRWIDELFLQKICDRT